MTQAVLTEVASRPLTGPSPEALIREARRRQRRRRVLLLSLVMVTGLIAFALLSDGGKGPAGHAPSSSGSARHVLARGVPQDAIDCVPRSVIDSLSPDGLPPLGGPLGTGLVTSRRENEQLIGKYVNRIQHDYPGVVALGTGPGWRRAWTKTNDIVRVVPVHDYAIVATVQHRSDCPDTPGYAAGYDKATIFFRHL